MSLNDIERAELVKLYWAKSAETLEDARLNQLQKRWNATANRLYYALFHAIAALYVSDGIAVSSHKGTKVRFGKEYVLSGLATEAEGKLLSQMEAMRERADYDVTFMADEKIINERFPLVEQMIHHIRKLIDKNR